MGDGQSKLKRSAKGSRTRTPSLAEPKAHHKGSRSQSDVEGLQSSWPHGMVYVRKDPAVDEEEKRSSFPPDFGPLLTPVKDNAFSMWKPHERAQMDPTILEALCSDLRAHIQDLADTGKAGQEPLTEKIVSLERSCDDMLKVVNGKRYELTQFSQALTSVEPIYRELHQANTAVQRILLGVESLRQLLPDTERPPPFGLRRGGPTGTPEAKEDKDMEPQAAVADTVDAGVDTDVDAGADTGDTGDTGGHAGVDGVDSGTGDASAAIGGCADETPMGATTGPSPST